ncbi:hypothetical protein ACQUFY_08400 [Robbsia andropogonis]|uniref:hypothetical protein n=1 Tax=Robbsia andropogonis TaxID=28092 RepID=UPI003D19331D
MNAIFESVEQALHVSFMVISLPSRQKNTFRLALIQALEQVADLTARQEATLEYLRGTRIESTINFEGLTGDEVRAQCAMVVAAVRDRLPADERNAVWIRYARGIPARPRSAGLAADPGVPPSAEWKQAVWDMANKMRKSIGTAVTDRDTIMALITGHAFPQQRETLFSYASIARDTGHAERTLKRAASKVRQQLRGLEFYAVQRLKPTFERDRLVSSDEIEVVAQKQL